MIKLLIADDEAIIRKGIRHHIDWAAHDIAVVGEAADGKTALQTALAVQPDIVVADIRMPLMSGLEMAEELHRLMPCVRVILLSGYSDKEYLMQAIKSGVDDYVMKTANIQDILDSVLAAKERILEERTQQKDSDSSSKIIEQNYLPIRGAFLMDLIGGAVTTETLLERAVGLDIVLTGPGYFLFQLLVDPDMEQDALLTLLFHFDRYLPLIVPQAPGKLTGVLNCPSDDAPDAFEETCRQIMQRFSKQGCRAKLYISALTPSLLIIPSAYQEVQRLVRQSCWDPPCSIVFCERMSPTFPLPLEIQLQLEGELLAAFSSRSIQDFEEKLSQYYLVLENHRFPFSELQESAKRIVTSMYNTMSSYERAYKVIDGICKAKTVLEIFGMLTDTMRTYAEPLPQNNAIQLVTEYINENYGQPIQLSQLAKKCYITPSYLSRIFKEEMKVGVVQYIHQVRIEQAKKLLRSTEDKVADIAAHVGYSNYKQFSSYFLKIAGLSPREYRAHKSNR